MSDLILINQKPQCLTGCAYFREIKGLSGSRYPKCALQMMVTFIQEGQLVIDVKECPEFTTPDQVIEQLNTNNNQNHTP